MQKEGAIMTGQILVALSSRDRIEEVIPHIEEMATAGMRVVFLIRFPADPWTWLQDHWVTTESSREATLVGRKIMERYSWDLQRALAEERVAPWHPVLQNIGVEVSVDLFTGSFASAAASYNGGGEFSLIMRPQNGFAVTRFLHSTIGFVGLLKNLSFRPVFSPRSRGAIGKLKA
jgi:hypothetical protein